MSDENSKRELKFDVPTWLQNLLELAADTGNAMFDTELSQKDPELFDEVEDSRKEFKAYLRELYFWYEPKFEGTDIDLGEKLDDKLDNAEDVWELSFEEAKDLFRKIRDLMEELKHTRFEGKIHQDHGV